MSHAVVMGKPKRYGVEQSSQLLKRLYFVEREVMRTIGGYLASIANWELKLLLPKHMWQDSLRADALRTRVLELRYPRRDVEQGHDPQLQAILARLICCDTDAEFVEGVYFAVKTSLGAAYRHYLEETDALDDAPTVEFMERYPAQINRQLDEITPLYYQLVNPRPNVRQQELSQLLEMIGGIFGRGTSGGNEGNPPELPPLAPPSGEYKPPVAPVRDPRFAKALYHVRPTKPRTFIEEQIRAGTSHVNEIWASEVPGLAMWKWNDMPWDFYMDLARWAYDEARHTQMGAERLTAWGFKLGEDIPMCSEMHTSQEGYGELGLLTLLHAFECLAPANKSMLKNEYEKKGDTASSQDFDYDWADESIHMAYGHKWLLHRIGGDADLLEQMKEEALARYYDHVDKLEKIWDYQPYEQRISQKIAEIEARRHG